MKVAFDKTVPLPVPAAVAWEFLQDIEAVAGCMPGAKITERLEAGRYKGTMTVKIGPATMSFRGDINVRDVDQAGRSLTLAAKGTDSTGTSGATMDLKARIEPRADGTSDLFGASEVSMSGKAAAFGGRMMTAVADQIMQQFAAQFSARATAFVPQPRSPEATAGSAATQDADANRALDPGANAPLQPPPVATELNGLALAWAIFKDWLRGLFGRKPA